MNETLQSKQKLDLSALEKAIFQLQNSLHYYSLDVVQQDPAFAMQMRAAAIQAFEFTYELSCKMIKRYLNKAAIVPNEQREISFADLIRTANEYGLLLNDLETWLTYRKERGTTSHTYDEEKAIEIFEEIPAFLEESKFLLNQLKIRNDAL